jgi:ribA/ribD-fused uncharacterized protein
MISPTKRINFYEADKQWGQLSNFFLLDKPLKYQGREYKTSEHLYQAMKFMYPGASKATQDYVDVVRCAKTPYMAKIVATQQLANGGYAWRMALNAVIEAGLESGVHMAPDWDEYKNDRMRLVLAEKFLQNETCRGVLVKTGDAQLAEHTTRDKYWGDGGIHRNGLNMLGMLLMEERTKWMPQPTLPPKPVVEKERGEKRGHDDDATEPLSEVPQPPVKQDRVAPAPFGGHNGMTTVPQRVKRAKRTIFNIFSVSDDPVTPPESSSKRIWFAFQDASTDEPDDYWCMVTEYDRYSGLRWSLQAQKVPNCYLIMQLFAATTRLRDINTLIQRAQYSCCPDGNSALLDQTKLDLDAPYVDHDTFRRSIKHALVQLASDESHATSGWLLEAFATNMQQVRG